MEKNKIVPVILCGGSGTRLWPLSRKNYPKQFIALTGEYSMLQETCLRVKNIEEIDNFIIITHESHRFIVSEQLAEIGILNPTIILEPIGRNTAPAITVAALHQPDNILLILPADHFIKHPDHFHEAVLHAKKIATHYLVTFGVQPTCAETGYGYIKKSKLKINETAVYADSFVEKPDARTARAYCDSGEYEWNSGMFMFDASFFLNELKKVSPDILEHCRLSLQHAKKNHGYLYLNEDYFSACDTISIDYALMEKSTHVAVVPLVNSGWSDLGSWDAVCKQKSQDDNQNVLVGDVHIKNVSNCYLHAEHRLLSAVGLKDHIIIETRDAVLVAHKEAAQEVKEMVAMLNKQNRPEVLTHQRVYRPWGYYELIDVSQFFQAKRISVKGNHALSLQLHKFRSEHWIILSGQAEVTCGDKVFLLEANQSTYIPTNTKHRLKNIGEAPLLLIEVQTGSYLGEDDIVRFEDNYGREVEVTLS